MRVIKVIASVVTLSGIAYGAYKFYGVCKKAYVHEIADLKKEIQDTIDNIAALNSRHNIEMTPERNALLEEARNQLMKSDPDIDTLRSLLNILKTTLKHMIQGDS